ncbi:MAG TPA: SPOR domain-containing protein [Thermodesulfobacteriota bacterium]|nr:SPOR domain-containing protein [Thermodesulfobacteriota bacterium]
MENGQDKKAKDKQIPQEEIFGELDAMYQRVADIEKEEASEVLSQEETKNEAQAGPERESRKRSGPNPKRSYRPFILGGIAVLFAAILAITYWKQTAILQLLRIGEPRQPMVSSPARPRKPSLAVTTSATPSPPPVATPPAAPAPPVVAASSAPPSPSPKSFPVQAKQEAVKTPREEVEKAKSVSQEIAKPDKPLSQEKYYAVQVGSFRNMENVRELAEILKKEGLDAYWISMKGHKGETLHRVFVGQFADRNEAAQFLRGKKFLRTYPGSFIQEVSASKVIEGNTK